MNQRFSEIRLARSSLGVPMLAMYSIVRLEGPEVRGKKRGRGAGGTVIAASLVALECIEEGCG